MPFLILWMEKLFRELHEGERDLSMKRQHSHVPAQETQVRNTSQWYAFDPNWAYPPQTIAMKGWREKTKNKREARSESCVGD